MPSPGIDAGGAAMGAFQREYGQKSPRRSTILALLGLIAIFPLGLGVCWLIVAEPPERTGDWIAAVTMALMFLAIGALPGVFWLVHRPTRVRVYEHGLEITRRAYRRSVRWDEVDAVRVQLMSYRVNGIPTGTNCKCVLRTATGDPLVLTHWIDGAIELAERAEVEVCRRRLPEARRLLASGRTVEFGRLFTLDSHRITRGAGDSLPWHQVESIVANDGFVTIRKVGKRWWWARKSYGDIPNARVLIGLVRELAALDGGRRRG